MTQNLITSNLKPDAMWITYPGDFEIWLGNIFNNRRTERGAMFPPFWKQDSHYVTVEFSRGYELTKEEEISIYCEGHYSFMLDGKLHYGEPSTFVIPAGNHMINIKVWNQSTPPALYIEGKMINTDSSWLVTYEDKIWIDENGVAHGSGIYVHAATSPYFQTLEQKPSLFHLETWPVAPVSVKAIDDGRLYDFGKEMMALIQISNIDTDGTIEVYYGESSNEALDHDHCETLDFIDLKTQNSKLKHNLITLGSKAFRYIHVVGSDNAKISALYEYLPQDEEKSGAFRCSDDEINRIWDVAAYTMDLTTREFFMDGIKRDRWTWSGDALQSYLMNYYLRFDLDTVKRTIRQLRGKDPVTAHINTIMDYSFYWFKSVLDYYMFSGDIEFIREIYPRMHSLMDYCRGRLDKDGWAEGKDDDWIFVDWVDFPMHKRGVMSFEQILFAKALETMMTCAHILEDNIPNCPPQGSLTKADYHDDALQYKLMYDSLRSDIDQTFWDNKQKAYVHSIENGKINRMVTKFPNMMSMIFGYTDPERTKEIMDNVMLNPKIEAITTPYMRFYELEALCQQGMQEFVTGEIKSYWGGMLKEGATSFWEKYIPTEKGSEHLAMYGRLYGKSLCHAWGASPIYLLGRYFMGIEPTSPGYKTWSCRPSLGALEWFEGKVPTPFGPIEISLNKESLTITSKGGIGTVYFNGREYHINPGSTQIHI